MKNTNLLRFLGIAVLSLFVWKTSQQRLRKRLSGGEKVLEEAFRDRPRTLDPAHVNSLTDCHVVSGFYEGLVTHEPYSEPDRLVPSLAAKMPTITEDGLTYTFQLKQGVRFHDDPCFPDGKGREMTAHDFVYTFKRLADPKTAATNFSFFEGRIKGLDAWRERCIDTNASDYTAPIAGLRAVDKYTFELVLTTPFVRLLDNLIHPASFVVPHEAVAHYGMDFIHHPVGTGAFVLEEYNPQGNRIVLRKNPTYREKRFPKVTNPKYKHVAAYAGRQVPLIDKLVYHILKEATPRWLQFRQGKLDFVLLRGLPQAHQAMDEKGQLKPELQQQGVQLFQAMPITVSMLVLNNSKPPFRDNVWLRRAMSLAFDRATYIKRLSAGSAIPAQSMLPPHLPAAAQDYVSPYSKFDVEEAKRLLAKAGYPEGKGLPVMTVDVPVGSGKQTEFAFIQQCMARIGIKLQSNPLFFPKLLERVYTNNSLVCTMGWVADCADGADFYDSLYGGYIGNYNPSFYDNARFNTLFEKAGKTMDAAKRYAIYQKMYKLVAEDVPVVFFSHAQERAFHHSWVKNFIETGYSRDLEQYFDIDVAEKMRQQKKLQQHKQS